VISDQQGVLMKPSHLPADTPEAQVRAYHQRTKHAFGRYAASPSYLDWDTQPNPFRRFANAPVTPLPLLKPQAEPLYADLFQPGTIAAVAPTLESIAALLELSFGLAAWKQHGGDRWALRCNPSSGNLHPTEAYIVAAGIEGLADGVHHYASHDHALEQRCVCEPPAGLWVGLSSVHWREAWKYGERAFRYCQHDIGHALGALRYAAATLGWRVCLHDAWGDDDLAALLGLDRAGDFAGAEPEAPDVLCWIDTGTFLSPADEITALLAAAQTSLWQGQANVLSHHHEQDWPVIAEVHAAAHKPRTAPHAFTPADRPALLPTVCELEAAELIKQRRSAQGFDGVTAIPAKTLFRLLDATLPRQHLPPFDLWNNSPQVHLLLFVHRVQGLPPGLYLFCRNETAEAALRKAITTDCRWEPVTTCPTHFRLFHLIRADARQAAKSLSCHQDIAADSAFSLGMLTEFDAGLSEGAWVYRRLFWECGLIGQALYLEAEAAGVRGTGIGCFFDDPVHDLLGLQDSTFQSLYHFTIGGPLVDQRLQTLPGYWHLQNL
jgi:SagB-type dehydrogenase family enzyme